MILPNLLAIAALLVLAQADSAVFSQYFGAATVTASIDPTLSAGLAICTNLAHAFPAPQAVYTSYNDQLAQGNADAVCQLCTSLSQSRIDSCCAVPTSVECFKQFAPSGKAQKTPATNSATGTGTANPFSATASTIATKSSSGNKNVCLKELILNLVVKLIGMKLQFHISGASLMMLGCLVGAIFWLAKWKILKLWNTINKYILERGQRMLVVSRGWSFMKSWASVWSIILEIGTSNLRKY